MIISKRPFGSLPDGQCVTCWTLESDDGLRAEVLDYGVTIHALYVPDRDGKPVDIVLGYDTLEEYLENGGYLGATVGRFANRIGGAAFPLNGKTYHLAVNDGKNHLHGGLKGFDRYVWTAQEDAEGVCFSRLSPDMEEGYPGNMQVSVHIGWQGRTLTLRYRAACDQDTILNLTNHSYFNLDGAGTVEDQLLTINADRFTVNDVDCLTTGEIADVRGTAMDFLTEHRIGERADSDNPCVRFFGGYDSNLILNGNPAAIARSEKSGIVMELETDQPGVQLYTANHMARRTGKNGIEYGHHSAFCLETQHFPDSIHHPEWPSCILRAGEVFSSYTSFTFSTK